MSHSEGTRVDKFCAQRKDRCDKDGQKYRDNCRVPWTYQAHHVLCVASVTQYLASVADIKKIVKQTDWCINTAENMLAMPPYFGTLVKYYAQRLRESDFAPEPGFKDIPIHSYDHLGKAGYKNEIDTEIKAIANRATKSKEAHDVTSGTMKGELDAYRDRMKTALKKRGARGKGTHKEWLSAYAGKPSAEWYMPFSMADDDDVEPRSFPLRRSKVSIEKVAKLVKNLI